MVFKSKKDFIKGEVATAITIGSIIVLGAISLVSSYFLNKQRQTTKSKAAEQNLPAVEFPYGRNIYIQAWPGDDPSHPEYDRPNFYFFIQPEGSDNLIMCQLRNRPKCTWEEVASGSCREKLKQVKDWENMGYWDAWKINPVEGCAGEDYEISQDWWDYGFVVGYDSVPVDPLLPSELEGQRIQICRAQERNEVNDYLNNLCQTYAEQLLAELDLSPTPPPETPEQVGEDSLSQPSDFQPPQTFQESSQVQESFQNTQSPTTNPTLSVLDTSPKLSSAHIDVPSTPTLGAERKEVQPKKEEISPTFTPTPTSNKLSRRIRQNIIFEVKMKGNREYISLIEQHSEYFKQRIQVDSVQINGEVVKPKSIYNADLSRNSEESGSYYTIDFRGGNIYITISNLPILQGARNSVEVKFKKMFSHRNIRAKLENITGSNPLSLDFSIEVDSIFYKVPSIAFGDSFSDNEIYRNKLVYAIENVFVKVNPNRWIFSESREDFKLLWECYLNQLDCTYDGVHGGRIINYYVRSVTLPIIVENNEVVVYEEEGMPTVKYVYYEVCNNNEKFYHLLRGKIKTGEGNVVAPIEKRCRYY